MKRRVRPSIHFLKAIAPCCELIECRPHKQIANRVDVSLRTVEKRKKEIFERLNVGTFTELLGLLKLADAGLAGHELTFQKGA